MSIDMWYGNDYKEATSVNVFFNDLTCRYTGNIYKGNKAIGDYTADSLQEVQEKFKGIAHIF